MRPAWVHWEVTPEDLWAGMTAIGNFGVTWRAQTDGVRSRMRAAYDAAVPSWLDEGILRFPVECVLVVADRR